MNPCARFLKMTTSAMGALLCAAGLAAAEEYARPELLAEPEALAGPDRPAGLVVLDCRAREAYREAHIPGALWLNHDAWSKEFGAGQDAEEWSRRIASLGVAADSRVVVYDDANMKDAARIWWILRYWGVENAGLLNGGWKAWVSEGHPTATAEANPAARTGFQAVPLGDRLATKEEVLALLAGKEAQIIDARSTGEFCGTDKGKNERGGAIPGARHLEWSDLLDPETGRFRTAAELSAKFLAAGIDPGRPAVTHCQTGGRASVMVFGLELMGAGQVANYYQGWSEWGNTDDTPVEPGTP